MTKCSVIIPCWVNDTETLTLTTNAIESFIGVDPHPNIEMIIVDNASSIGGGLMRTKADIYIRSNLNRGFTHAVNDGIRVAHGDYIALANNDIRVPENWLEVTTTILENSLIGTVHPKMIGYDEPFRFGNLASVDHQRWCQGSFLVGTHRFFKDMEREEVEIEPHPGLLDENYGIGGGADDWDFGFRVRKYAQQCFTNMTCFQHKNSHSLAKLGVERQKIVDQNNEYFKKKWGKSKEELFAEQFPEQASQDYYEVLKSL